MKKLFCLIGAMFIYGCTGYPTNLQTYQQTARIDNDLVDKYQVTQSPTEEYVTRVAKRVMIVSDNANDTIKVHVLESYIPELLLDHATNTIEISRGALQQLKDEAELAATLTLAMARMENVANPERNSALTLARAGYDPQALLELQQQYFNANNRQQAHWLSSVFPTPPTAGAITANQDMLENMPKGLLRGVETYNQHING